jgi:hypothetical protein
MGSVISASAQLPRELPRAKTKGHGRISATPRRERGRSIPVAAPIDDLCRINVGHHQAMASHTAIRWVAGKWLVEFESNQCVTETPKTQLPPNRTELYAVITYL